jgi:hypothetical protein
VTTSSPRLTPEGPTLIRLNYRTDHGLVDPEPLDSLTTWFVEATISGEARAEALDLLNPAATTAEMAGVEVDASVGEMVFLRVPMYAAEDPWIIMDAHSSRLASLAEQVLAPGAPNNGQWAPDLDAMLEGGTGDLLVVSETVFDPQWRGFGLGPALIGSAIYQLSSGCAAAAVQPWPVEGSVLTEADHRAGFARLAEMFGRLGFEHLHDDVLILDLFLQKAEDLSRAELAKTAALGERYQEHQRSLGA